MDQRLPPLYRMSGNFTLPGGRRQGALQSDLHRIELASSHWEMMHSKRRTWIVLICMIAFHQ